MLRLVYGHQKHKNFTRPVLVLLPALTLSVIGKVIINYDARIRAKNWDPRDDGISVHSGHDSAEDWMPMEFLSNLFAYSHNPLDSSNRNCYEKVREAITQNGFRQ